MIPNDVQDSNTEYKNLSTQYSEISIKNIRAFDKTYIDNPMRAAQDCHMMYKFIMNSLSVEAKTKFNVWSGSTPLEPTNQETSFSKW